MPAPNTASAVENAIKRHPGNMRRKLAAKPKTRSKATIFTVSQLLETYRDPRAILLEIASTDTHKLAEQTGCTPLEALAERRMCAQAVLPYVVQKLPVQVDMRHTRAIHLNIVDDRQYEQLLDLTAEPGADDSEGLAIGVLPTVVDDTQQSERSLTDGDATPHVVTEGQ